MSSKANIKNMNQEKKHELKPKLRFPEFLDAGEWEVKPLESMCFLITKGTTPTTLGFQFVGSGIGFIKIESIDQNGSINCKQVTYITEECDQALKRSRLEENDILFSIAGALGIVALVPSHVLPANINQALAIIRIKPEYSHHYLMRFLNSHLIQSEILRIKAGAAQLNISLSQLGNFQVLLPARIEQQKIADCLSSISDRITLETQKLNTLKTHKKGLMQQLFPAEGETMPKLRFPEFQDSGEWEDHSLAKISTRIIEKVGDLFLMPVSITAGQGFVSQAEKFGRNIAGQQYKNYIVLNKGEFAYNKGNSKKYPQGCIYKLKEFQQVAAPNAFICFRLKNEYVSGFYQCYFEANFHGLQLQKFITSGARSDGLLNVSPDDFFSMKFLAPNKEEQQKIADCFSSLDELIAAQAQASDTLKTHKKGLMQQLFPSVEEVKG